MNVEQFYKTRQEEWKQFELLLKFAEGNLTKLTPEQVERLGQYYRATSSDLALAQRDFPRHRVTTYLNQLVARGHSVLYRGEPLSLKGLKTFFKYTLPQTYREALPFILTATLLFFIPAIIAGVMVSQNADASLWLLPPSTQDLRPGLENQETWVNIPLAERPYFSSFIMTNNIRVAILAFAAGMTAGVFTVYIMLFNGLSIGGVLGLTIYYGLGWELFNFIMAHGVIELTAIFIAGGAGLMVGKAILKPGLLRRRDAIMQAAQKAVVLALGCIPILFVAGLIEGFISPNELIPWPVKWSIGIMTGVLLQFYLLRTGRTDAP